MENWFQTIGSLGDFLGFFVEVITLIIAAKIWLQVRTKRAKKLTLGTDAVVINWNGHPFSAPWAEGMRVYNGDNAVTPQFKTTATDALRESLEQLFDSLPGEYRERLKRGDRNIIIVLPGLGAANAMMMPILHGIMGCFPTVTFSLRGDDGKFFFPKPLSLQDIRMDYRGLRDAK